MAMTEVIETSSAERQSAILTVVLRHHINAAYFWGISSPFGAAPLLRWALCIDPMVWIASVELAPSVWKTEILAVILHPHINLSFTLPQRVITQ